jgi:BT4734-like, N-terminal domain/Primase C terminal 2 (PriCT-2)
MSDDSISGHPRPAADQSEPSQSPLDHHISLYTNVRGKAPIAELSLREWLSRIRDGKWRKQVLVVRELYGDEAAYKAAKAKLPCVTACGTFTTHEAANLQRHNQTVHADVDTGLDGRPLTPEQLQKALDHLRQDPTVVYAFRGPSGHGLKYGVHIPEVTTSQAYRHAWEAVSADHRQRFGIAWDKSAKDISRLCFVSYDPDCYINPDEPSIFPIPEHEKKPPRQPRQQTPSTLDRDLIEDALRPIPSEDREVWLRVGMALHSIEEPWARDAWDAWSQTTSRENYSDRDQEET